MLCVILITGISGKDLLLLADFQSASAMMVTHLLSYSRHFSSFQISGICRQIFKPNLLGQLVGRQVLDDRVFFLL